MDILEHNKEGFLYPYKEAAMLAEYVSRYFESNKLCLEYGENARKSAFIRHNPEENYNRIIEIYTDIMGKK